MKVLKTQNYVTQAKGMRSRLRALNAKRPKADQKINERECHARRHNGHYHSGIQHGRHNVGTDFITTTATGRKVPCFATIFL